MKVHSEARSPKHGVASLARGHLGAVVSAVEHSLASL